MFLAAASGMSVFIHTCERCDECFAGDSYRVISENDGERLLDMLVCYSCYLEASRLGLDAEAIEINQVALH